MTKRKDRQTDRQTKRWTEDGQKNNGLKKLKDVHCHYYEIIQIPMKKMKSQIVPESGVHVCSSPGDCENY